MKPGKFDLPTVWRGCNYATITLRWLDQDGNPIDLTGWVAQARSKSVDFHPAITDPANGWTTLGPLTNIQTKLFRLGVEQWDWIFINTFNGAVFPTPLLAGTVEIKEPKTPTVYQPPT